MVELAPDFDEFFGSLIDSKVEFLVVGAYALAYHGAPRYTGDIDVFLKPTTENAARLLQALSAVGFPPTHLGPSRDLPFIGRSEFIRNKRASGRLKDLADIEALGF